ncbi:MAG: sigma-70 family RNA polymerase sigma factor [Phycisphaera sp.]|nr:sigma-70 family RNA polymerase sigma factor [Phycisphaera sp.]
MSSAGGCCDPLDVDATFIRFEKVLRKVASRSLRSSGSFTSQTTALLHDAWVRLDAKREDIVNEDHLLALAIRVVGHLAVDRHRAAMRRRERIKVLGYVTEEKPSNPSEGDATVARVEALIEDISLHSSRAATVAKLKLFRSMNLQEIAAEIGASERTVSYDWKFARAMLASGLRSQ